MLVGQTADRRDVDRTTQCLRELRPHCAKIDEGSARRELDEEIEVAVARVVTSRCGTKDPDPDGTVGSRDLENPLPLRCENV